ncbi:MAG TPA: type IV toxin-antitoxin system AbiEi family antitoxin, partial [Pararobbsia sp.]|nr:type IV toxin-antitoxin system AbiEi family antitoxin [Pararobbsia sp.]
MTTQARLHTVEAALGAFTSVTGIGTRILKRKPSTPFSAWVKFDLEGGFQCPILTTTNVDRDERIAAIAATVRLRTSSEFVLVAPYLTANLLDACARLGLQAIDTSGNACLRYGQSRILVSGRPRVRQVRATKEQAWTKGTLRAALSLLVDPELVSRGVRQVSDIASVSVGTAHRALQTLVKRGDVKARSNGDYFYPRFRESVDEWAVLYPTTLRDSLLLGRFRSMTLDWWQHVAPSPNEWKFGGEPGAALLTGYLKPGVV